MASFRPASRALSQVSRAALQQPLAARARAAPFLYRRGLATTTTEQPRLRLGSEAPNFQAKTTHVGSINMFFERPMAQNRTGRPRLPPMARQQLGHSVLPPCRLHPCLHHRAWCFRQAEGRVREAWRQDDRFGNYGTDDCMPCRAR